MNAEIKKNQSWTGPVPRSNGVMHLVESTGLEFQSLDSHWARSLQQNHRLLRSAGLGFWFPSWRTFLIRFFLPPLLLESRFLSITCFKSVWRRGLSVRLLMHINYALQVFRQVVPDHLLMIRFQVKPKLPALTGSEKHPCGGKFLMTPLSEPRIPPRPGLLWPTDGLLTV